MSSILGSIQSNLDSLDRVVTRYVQMREAVTPFVGAIENLCEKRGARTIVISECIVVSMPLKSFRDCLPLLEDLESALKIDFDKTRDTDSYRIYSCSATPWIRVDGEVSIDDGTDPALKCKRVPTGKFNTYPEYKLVCEE